MQKPAQVRTQNFISRIKRLFTSPLGMWIGAIFVVILICCGVILASHNATPETTTQAIMPSPTPTTVATPSATPEPEGAPQLNITSPENGATISGSEVIVTGTVESGAKVTVNKIPADVQYGGFSAPVALTKGRNTITVETIGLSGLRSVRILSVTRSDAVVVTPAISLSGKLVGPDAKLTWTVTNLDTAKGFIVLRSLDSSPVAPRDIDTTVGKDTKTVTRYHKLSGNTYYYRVCQLTSTNACGVYSNVVPVLEQVGSSVGSINITGTTGTTINWEFANQSTGGFVVLWSLSPLPSYPSSETVYSNEISNMIATYGTMNSSVVSGQTYYVRVCENLGGKCGVYSNQVTVTAP